MAKGKFDDLTGRRFGRLVVVRRVPPPQVQRNAYAWWLCLCDCDGSAPPRERVINGQHLRRGTQSCGCLQIAPARHLMTETPTWNSWKSMLERCLNPNFHCYADYGGRGIKVCERWLVFENFLADMGERPAGMALDRFPNNDGNYEPGNCRWATPVEQNNNRRNGWITRRRRLFRDEVQASITEWTVDREAPFRRLSRSAQAQHRREREGYSQRRLDLTKEQS